MFIYAPHFMFVNFKFSNFLPFYFAIVYGVSIMRLPCCVVGCNEDLSRHRFPNPKTDLERMKQWVEVIGNPKLQSLDVSHIYANCRICSVHFELKYHCRNNRVSRNAIPTLNLPGSKVFETADTNTAVQDIDVSSTKTLLNTLIEEHSYADNYNALQFEIEVPNQVESQNKENQDEEDICNAFEVEMPNYEMENQHEEVPANFTWRSNTTKLLIQQYNLLKNDFRNPKMKKALLWGKIKDVFESHGYDVSATALDSKMRTLKHHYKYLLNNMKKSTTGRGRLKWEYFYDMEEAFREDKTINPAPVLSSVTTATSTCTTVPSQCTRSSPVFSLAPALPSPVYLPAPSLPSPEPDITSASPSPSPISTPPPPTQILLVSPTLCSPSSSINLRKRKRMSDLRTYRSKMLEIEERRAAALERLVKQMEENNRIQKEKNLLIERYLNRKSSYE